MRFAKRRALLPLAPLLLVNALSAQPCLVRGNIDRVSSLDTFRGVIQPQFRAVVPSPRLAIVLFPQTIPEDKRNTVSADLTALYRVSGSPSPLTLTAFNGQEFAAPSGPFRNVALWQKAVRAALAIEAVQTAAASTSRFDAMVAGALKDFGEPGSSVLLIGQLPDFEPEAQDYATAWLNASVCSQKVRVSVWNPGGAVPATWKAISEATGGAPNLATLSELAPSPDAEPLTDVSWTPPQVDRGFRLYRAVLRDQAGSKMADVPMVALGPQVQMPEPERYVELRRAARQAAELVRKEKLEGGEDVQAHALVERALAINPLDDDALNSGVAYFRRHQDFKSEAELLTPLTSLHPEDHALFAELGHCQFVAGDLEAAEKSLSKAREGKVGGAVVPEELFRIRMAHNDDAGALAFLEERLAIDGNGAALWYTRADIATRIGNWTKTAESLEKALAADEKNLRRRTSLVDLYLDHAANDQALRHVRFAAAALPADAAVRRQYAEYLDRLGQPDEAFAVWTKALESDPKMEVAHFRIARRLLEKGDVAGGLAAAERGLSDAPPSARMYLLKSEALERQGHYFEARRTLRDASKSAPDVALLAKLAEMEDVSGLSAWKAYADLAEALKSAPDSAQQAQTLERGMEVALRDGDAKGPGFFGPRLAAMGKGSLSDWLKVNTEAPGEETRIPGGLEALAFVAHSTTKSPQHFLADYCRALTVLVAGSPGQKTYLESIREYFQVVESLESLGTRQGDRVTFQISVADKASRQRAEKITDLLGWKLRTKKDGVTLEAGEKTAQGKRQETASALAIDEVGMQEALQAGREYTFEIMDERVPVVLGESKWLSAFFPKEKLSGGLAEGFTDDLRAAETYLALSGMSMPAVSALMSSLDLKSLAEKHADLICQYSSAFALRGSRAAVPGGPPADAVWEKLVGSSTAVPAKFFRALLEKDDGKLLAFFATLGQLDADHQRFLTRGATRTARFYDLFRESPDMAHGAERQSVSSSFVEFLREVPVDSEERVLFPGSPEVWMLARGNSSSTAGTAKMVKKLSRITAPEQEDEILLRLARTRYTASHEKMSELDNFVAVVRIDRHREEPLDEASALLLAQHYGEDHPIYPYFATLTALGQPQFERFFTLLDQWKTVPRLELNGKLGQLHALIEILCLAQESGAIEPKTAAELFGVLCDRMGKASSATDDTLASLDTVRDFLKRAACLEASDPDRKLECTLLGGGGPVGFEVGGVRYEIDPHAARSAAYRRVIDAQKVTSLKTLLEFDDVLHEMDQGKGSATEQLQKLGSLQAGLLTVEIPKSMHASEIDRKIVLEFDRSKVGELIARLKQRTSRKKVNLDDIRKISRELRAVICPQVGIALSGAVYARFLSPDDLLVSQDPLLLRKHRYLALGPGSQGLFPPADLSVDNAGAGSHIEGGFAGFPVVSGRVAVSAGKMGASTVMTSTQIAALRSTDWSRLTEQDLLRFQLRLRVAREWVLHAGSDEVLLADLAEDSLGVLSPTRRAQLLDAIRARDWTAAFQCVTLGDLYSLSDRYLERYEKDPWQSAVTAALRKTPAADDSRLLLLGGSSLELLGCDHPHLAMLGPYEQYEKFVLPYKLAERTAEFKLYLADWAGRVGIPTAALNVAGEPLVTKLLGHVKMNDIRDWRSVVQAFDGLDAPMVLAALETEK